MRTALNEQRQKTDGSQSNHFSHAASVFGRHQISVPSQPLWPSIFCCWPDCLSLIAQRPLERSADTYR